MASPHIVVKIAFTAQAMLDMREALVIRALTRAKDESKIGDSPTVNVEVCVLPGIDSSRTQRFLLPTMEDVALFTKFMNLFDEAMRDIVGAYPPDCEAYTTEEPEHNVSASSCLNSDAELYNELLKKAAKRFMELTGRVPPVGIFSVSAT